MRVLAVHQDVLVAISSIWQTTCTAVRSEEEGLLIDSPVYPAELDALPELLAQAGFPVSGLLATHGDWDHLLGRLAFPELALGCGESTAERLGAEPGTAARELRQFDEEHYVEGRAPLALAGIQTLPVPGRLSLGPERELELHPTGGHTPDGTAFLIDWAGVLVCGDYLSPVEIPAISPGGSTTVYLATLERLAPLVERIETVVPGHGAPLSRERAREIMQEDADYLRALERDGAWAPLPPSRGTLEQQRLHAENVNLMV
jgi:glyoxylase-like metal-dependent hydrolase (beta-lactamase superfamily II)